MLKDKTSCLDNMSSYYPLYIHPVSIVWLIATPQKSQACYRHADKGLKLSTVILSFWHFLGHLS